MKNVHIITGGSSGIGLECAKVFTEDLVIIAGRNEDRLKKAAGELASAGIHVAWKACDISSAKSVEDLFLFAKEKGHIKSVINSAGVSGIGIDPKATLEIDLLGTENVTEAALKYAEQGTAVILISSMMGHVIPPNEAYDSLLANPGEDGTIDKLVGFTKNDSAVAYNFAKRGVHLIGKRFAEAFGAKGARIVSLSPGIIMTPMAKEAAKEHPEKMEYLRMHTPAQRNGEPEDISAVVEFLVSDKASFITGTDITVDGGLTLNLHNLG